MCASVASASPSAASLLAERNKPRSAARSRGFAPSQAAVPYGAGTSCAAGMTCFDWLGLDHDSLT